MILVYAVAILLWLSMIAYAVLGGADLGGGTWNLFSFGKNAKQQEELIAEALGPVWEANNVWLIFLAVGLYTAFPLVSAILAIALFVPITLALIGFVMRGAAFAFQSLMGDTITLHNLWKQTFTITSLLTPLALGMTAAAVASGEIHVRNGHIPVAVIQSWLTPFAFTIGLMAIAICSTQAAIFLTVEAQGRNMTDLAEAFRTRALISGGIMALLGILGLALSITEAPIIWRGMLDHAIWAVMVTILLGMATAIALFWRQYRIARLLMGLETGAIIGTWGLAQIPYIVPPDVTIMDAASPSTTLLEFLICALIGMGLLIPSLWLLFHVFKGRNIVPPIHEKAIKE
jgi:cytochrome bd ubiquinol oxidase subunit II